MNRQKTILVIGLGEKYRRDDAAGLYVASQIKALGYAGVDVAIGVAESASLMEKWSGRDIVFVIDAVKSSAEPGFIFRFDAVIEELPTELAKPESSHGLGLQDAIKLSKALGELPNSLIVYGIGGGDFEMGEGLSAKVKKAALQVVELIKTEIEEIINK
jgi:hydrogenase maturation protease